MPDNLVQKKDICGPIVDAAHRQFSEFGLGRVVANFDFVKELITNRVKGNQCYSEVLDEWNRQESKGLSDTSKDELFSKHPHTRDTLKSAFPSADSLLRELDRDHDGNVSLKEVVNRRVELNQINESGTGNKQTQNELVGIGEVFGYLKYKKQFNPSNASEPSATSAELESVFYK